MKYIKSNEYTYEEMWDDTQNILDKYSWELRNVETTDDGWGMAELASRRFFIKAIYYVDPNRNTSCSITQAANLELDEMEIAVDQLKHICDDLDNAMPQFI